MINRSLIGCALSACVTLSACGVAEDFSEEQDVEAAESSIINGTQVPEGSPFVRFSNCSGTAVTSRTVLTAKHCVTDRASNPASISMTVGSASTVGVAVMQHPTLDAALVRTAVPLPRPNSVDGGTAFPKIYQGDAMSIAGINSRLVCYGFGYNTYLSGFGVLRRGDNLRPFSATPTHYEFRANASGQVAWRGDSGGSCYYRGSDGNLTVTGVQSSSWHNAGSQTVNSAVQVSIPGIRDWIEARETYQNVRVSSRQVSHDQASVDRYCSERGYGWARGYGTVTVPGSTVIARWTGTSWQVAAGDTTPPINDVRVATNITCARI